MLSLINGFWRVSLKYLGLWGEKTFLRPDAVSQSILPAAPDVEAEREKGVVLLMEKYKIQPCWNGLWKDYFSNIKLGIRYFNFWLCEEERRALDTHFYTLRVGIKRSVAADHDPNQHWSLNSWYRTWVLWVFNWALSWKYILNVCVDCWVNSEEFETNKLFLIKKNLYLFCVKVCILLVHIDTDSNAVTYNFLFVSSSKSFLFCQSALKLMRHSSRNLNLWV